MIFLLSQMAISLALAALVGGCIGWLFHRYRYSGQVEQYRKLAVRQQTQVKQAQSEVNMLADDYDDLQRRSHAEIDALKQENRQLPALNQNLEKSQLLVRQLMQKHETQLREITAENESLRTKFKNVDHREQALNQLQAGLVKTRKRAKTLREAPVDGTDADLTKPMGTAALTEAAAEADTSDSGDQTALDLEGDVVQDTDADDPNDELHAFEEPVYDEDDTESLDESGYEDDADGEYDYEDDEEQDAEASDEDGEWEYVYEDDDEEDDEEFDEEAEYDDDDAEYEDEEDVEYLDDASDRMLQSKSSGRSKNNASKSPVRKQAGGKKSSVRKNAKKSAGTEEAVTNRSGLVDPEPLVQLFDSVDQHDDLQQIFGIGPVTEKALNTLGITSYSQLADLKSHDIEKIADALQIFPGRIERDNWVGSARRQLEEVLEEL